MESIKTPIDWNTAVGIVASVLGEEHIYWRSPQSDRLVDILLAVDAASRKQAQDTLNELDEAKREIRKLRQAQEPLVDARRSGTSRRRGTANLV